MLNHIWVWNANISVTLLLNETGRRSSLESYLISPLPNEFAYPQGLRQGWAMVIESCCRMVIERARTQTADCIIDSIHSCESCSVWICCRGLISEIYPNHRPRIRYRSIRTREVPMETNRHQQITYKDIDLQKEPQRSPNQILRNPDPHPLLLAWLKRRIHYRTKFVYIRDTLKNRWVVHKHNESPLLRPQSVQTRNTCPLGHIRHDSYRLGRGPPLKSIMGVPFGSNLTTDTRQFLNYIPHKSPGRDFYTLTGLLWPSSSRLQQL